MTKQKTNKPSDNQISDLGFKLGFEERLIPCGLTDLPADFHSNELDKICEGGNYYAYGDEEGDRMFDIFRKGFTKGLNPD